MQILGKDGPFHPDNCYFQQGYSIKLIPYPEMRLVLTFIMVASVHGRLQTMKNFHPKEKAKAQFWQKDDSFSSNLTKESRERKP